MFFNNTIPKIDYSRLFRFTSHEPGRSDGQAYEWTRESDKRTLNVELFCLNQDSQDLRIFMITVNV
jgi:hypothetical protein